MAKKPKTNGADDDDLKQIAARYDEAFETERKAKQDATDKRKRAVKILEAEAKQIGVDVSGLRKARQIIAQHEKLKAMTDGIKDDSVELVADMVSVISGWGETPLGAFMEDILENRNDAAAAQAEAEQAEGAAVLDELAGEAVH